MRDLLEVKFYYDYKSSYTCVGMEPALALEQSHRVRLRYIPFDLDIRGLFGDVDNRPEWAWRKIRYSYYDVRRFAAERGILIRGPKKVFDSRLALIGGLYADKHGQFKPYSLRVITRFFRRELDIEDSKALGAVLAEVGLDPLDFEDYAKNEGPADFEQCAAESNRDKVFGVPTLVVDGELFWGNDRIDWVVKKLDKMGLRR